MHDLQYSLTAFALLRQEPYCNLQRHARGCALNLDVNTLILFQVFCVVQDLQRSFCKGGLIKVKVYLLKDYFYRLRNYRRWRQCGAVEDFI